MKGRIGRQRARDVTNVREVTILKTFARARASIAHHHHNNNNRKKKKKKKKKGRGQGATYPPARRPTHSLEISVRWGSSTTSSLGAAVSTNALSHITVNSNSPSYGETGGGGSESARGCAHAIPKHNNNSASNKKES